MVITTFKLFHDFDKAQSRIWEIEETRSFWKRILIYMLLTFSVPVSMALIFGVLGPKGMALFQEIPRDYVAVFFIWITLFSIFKWWPIKNVETHTAFIGSVIVMGLLSALEESYAWLFKKFFKFGKVYGSLASVPMFLVWLQLIWLVILVGIAAIATYTHYRESKINPHKKIIKKGR
jgi:membrane protein